MGNSPKDVAPPDAANVRLFTTDKSWIEGAALAQLNLTARLPGMVLAAGFPDLHPGKGLAVGAAFVSRSVFHPALAGNDIGCGMSFWATDCPARKLKLDRLEKRISGLSRRRGTATSRRGAIVSASPRRRRTQASVPSAAAITSPSCRWSTRCVTRRPSPRSVSTKPTPHC